MTRWLSIIIAFGAACGSDRTAPPSAAGSSTKTSPPTKTVTAVEALAAVRATAAVPEGYQGRIKSADFIGLVADDDRPAIYVSRIAGDGVRTLEDFVARGGLADGTIAHQEAWDTGWLIVIQPKSGGEPLVMSYSAAGGGDEVFLCQGERDAPIVRSVCKSLRPAR